MSNAELRAQCAELVDALENARRIIHGGDGTLHIDTAEPVLRRAYALLAQLAPEPPVDGDVAELVDNCIVAYAEDPGIISSGRYMMIDDGKARAALLQQLSTPTPPPEPPTDEELDEFVVFWWGAYTDESTVTDVIEDDNMAAFARAALERWGQR